MMAVSSCKNFDNFLNRSLTHWAYLSRRHAISAANCVPTRHYYSIFICAFANQTLFLTALVSSTVISVEAALINEVRAEFELAFIF
jgi:hypothetical protein